MARCAKCNVEIPEGKELCEECEQFNNESYLDRLLHTVASDDQITLQAENAKKIRLEKMKEKIDPNRANVSKKNAQDDGSEEKPDGAEAAAWESPSTEEAASEAEASAAETYGEREESDETGRSGEIMDEPPVPLEAEAIAGESLPTEGAPSEAEALVLEASDGSEEPQEPEESGGSEELNDSAEPQQSLDDPFGTDVLAGETTETIETNEMTNAAETADAAEMDETEFPEGLSTEGFDDEKPDTELTASASGEIYPNEFSQEGQSETFDAGSVGEGLDENEEESEESEEIGGKDALPGESESRPGDTSTDHLPEYFAAGSEPEEGAEEALPYQGEDTGAQDQGPVDVPRKETGISVTDYAEDDRNDKYMLTPEEEAAFEFEIPDDIDREDNWGGGNYDIFGDDAPSDDEFDGMLREIADTQKDPMFGGSGTAGDLTETGKESAAVADTGSGQDTAAETELFGLSDLAAGEEIPLPEVSSPPDDPFPPDALPEAAGLFPANDTSQTNISEQNVEEKEGIMTAAVNEAENDGFNDGAETQEDILDLINSLYNSDEEPSFPPTEEVASGESYGTEDDLEMSGQQDDFADMLSNVLPDGDLSSIPDISEMDEKEGEASEKKKKKKKKKAKDKDKPSLMHRLFGNIKTERSEEEIAQMKEKIVAEAEAKEAAKEAKAAKAAADKEEKKKKAAEDKAAAAKKKQEKEKKKAEDAKAKKEAKDKKKQEVQNLIDAIDEDEGRINRVGASIVFVLFAVIAVAVLLGTEFYSYKQSIANAKESFEYDHYNEAYEEIAGLEMREEDENFSLQVKVVMYTYKQLNSFNNYYAAGMYPEALDSLLKGLKRYDKYFPVARVLEVDEDLVLVRGEILNKLEEVYSLTEQDAVELSSMRNREAYSRQVYDIAGRITE